MVHHHNGIAVFLPHLKAIRREFAKYGGYLIFEFDNVLFLSSEKVEGEWQDGSYRNEPVSRYYEDPLELQSDFDAWIKIWSDSFIRSS